MSMLLVCMQIGAICESSWVYEYRFRHGFIFLVDPTHFTCSGARLYSRVSWLLVPIVNGLMDAFKQGHGVGQSNPKEEAPRSVWSADRRAHRRSA
ncbi:hypothetical protein BD289DRAFT_430604 [Coniella lustricola]|uniref:Uncharacterized protein n=1 Tax=Coniella lustricola TaxID=2025994 RepID=A0A2T3ABX4_9PEZI|nr:hypothetical protein BD289DRAFT_430604 [Coniella lustricola]